ncbi:MAG: YeeE/YedE family protein [Candidatus Kapabacteria bacterium]|nr:YeeE/YedE family protein [Ignavibacteriota bacterium]MCW5883734.1 YeeE/YedE family protein [Candidatus Kapabacteria bacterium]
MSIYSYPSNIFAGNTSNSYFLEVQKSGKFEVWFLLGAFLSAIIYSAIRKEFKPILIHDNWSKMKNNSNISRVVWSFIGGFLLLFGARLAGGCTSGHVISGGLQFAVSSYIFAIFVFVSFLSVGRLYYKNS